MIVNGVDNDAMNVHLTNKYRREYRRDNQKWTIQRNWQHRIHKTKIYVGHHFTQTNTHNAIRHKLSYKQLEVKTKFGHQKWTHLVVILKVICFVVVFPV